MNSLQEPGVRLRNVSKRFSALDVVKSANISIDRGEFVVFVGPSGCGKSTLLRLIAGLETVSDGSIHIEDTDVTALPPAQRGAAMVFQSYALYPHLSVFDNMGFSLSVARRPKQEIRTKVLAAAQSLQLTDYLDRKPSELSGGQRQRVAIGRAIVRQPRVFLFDEPLSNLDAELRVQMRMEIARLHQEIGATMIYVTHDQVEAMTLAQRIVVLRDGIVQQIGAPLELYNDPDNQFVAGFIGSPRMNFIPMAVRSIDETRAVVFNDQFPEAEIRIEVAAGELDALKSVTLGIRPEHIQLAPADGISLPVQARFTEELGGTSYVYASGPGEMPLIIETRAHSGPMQGSAIATLPRENIYLFTDSGMRLRAKVTTNANHDSCRSN